MGGHVGRDVSRNGDDECAVARATLRDEETILIAGLQQLRVADVVTVKTGGLNVPHRSRNGGNLLRQRVDVEQLQASLIGPRVLVHGIEERGIDQQVVVGLSHLQEALAACGVVHQGRCVAPDAIGRTHVDRGIELPARPLSLLRRVGGAVEEDMVHAREEEEVEVGLHLRERHAEMLGQPGKGLARGERLAHDVGRTRGILQRGQVAQVLSGEAGVGAQASDVEVAQSEALYLWYVDGSVDVEQVAGRTVALVARSGPVLVGPLRPLAGEVV